MLYLNNVTLLSVDSLDPERTIYALNESSKNIKFESIKLITTGQCKNKCLNVNNIDVSYNDKVDSYENVSNFLISDIYKYVDTDFALFIEWDGYVLDYTKWSNKFLKYDYIGASWKVRRSSARWKGLSDVIDENKMVVGNGGFSIRSRRLLEFLGTDKYILDQLTNDDYLNQDMFICRKNRRYIMNNGFTFAPTDLANKFSAERIPYSGQFGWHGTRNRKTLPLRLLNSNKWIKDRINKK